MLFETVIVGLFGSTLAAQICLSLQPGNYVFQVMAFFFWWSLVFWIYGMWKNRGEKIVKLWILDQEWVDSLDATGVFIVRAESEEEAREIANRSDPNLDSCDAWLDPDSSSCEELQEEGQAGVILSKQICQ